MSGYSRGNPSMGDIVRSVLVLGGIVLAIFLIGRLFTATPEHPTSEVDWRAAASGVEPRAGFTPLGPETDPADWRATRADLQGDRWQLGFITEDDEYVGLTQRPGEADGLPALVEDRAADSESAGTVVIAGQEWGLWTSAKATTFARVDGGQLVVVTGTAERDVIEDYVASLARLSS